MWVLFAFGSAIFAGITAILAKYGIRDTDSNLATAIRTVFVLLFAWLMVFIVGSQNQLSTISSHTLLFLILSGLATGASWLFYFKALQMGSVSKVTPIDKSSLLMTMLLAMIFLDEGITALKVVCMILIGVGTWLMIQKDSEENPTPDHGAENDSPTPGHAGAGGQMNRLTIKAADGCFTRFWVQSLRLSPPFWEKSASKGWSLTWAQPFAPWWYW